MFDPEFVKWLEKGTDVSVQIDCENPLEISDSDGGGEAKGWMAETVLRDLIEEYEEDTGKQVKR